MAIWAKGDEVFRFISPSVAYPDNVMEFERKDMSAAWITASVRGFEKDSGTRCVGDRFSRHAESLDERAQSRLTLSSAAAYSGPLCSENAAAAEKRPAVSCRLQRLVIRHSLPSLSRDTPNRFGHWVYGTQCRVYLVQARKFRAK